MFRSEYFQVRVSPKEKALYRKEALKHKMGLSRWLRELANKAIGIKTTDLEKGPSVKKMEKPQKSLKTVQEFLEETPVFRPKLSSDTFKRQRAALMEDFIKKGGKK